MSALRNYVLSYAKGNSHLGFPGCLFSEYFKVDVTERR